MSQPSIIGNYRVTSEFIDKRSFLTVEEKQDDGTVEEKTVVIKRTRRNLTLSHVDTSEHVIFSAYVHQGQLRFKDSRNKSSLPTDSHVVTELRRMLLIDASTARQMLAF